MVSTSSTIGNRILGARSPIRKMCGDLQCAMFDDNHFQTRSTPHVSHEDPEMVMVVMLRLVNAM